MIPSNIEERKLGAKTSIQTKQTTMRLEVKVSERLSSICRANELSREVFLEALFEYYEVDPDAWNKILVEAKIKGEQRQNLANLKRAQSMMQRFGE
ncbi:CopG family transcriptional regulator [Chlorogloea sp. CCALA 695]|nr:CopG family transcriptional regulator [Chlorogloea sp. CCALA 695]